MRQQIATYPVDCIVVMGVSGCGKSSLGRHIAAALPGWHYHDGDWSHPPENMSKIKAGTPLRPEERAIFVERLMKAIASEAALGKNVVVAWSALREEHRQILFEMIPRSHFVYLKISEETALAQSKARRELDPDAPHPDIVPDQFKALQEPKYGISVPEGLTLEEKSALVLNALRPSLSQA